VGRYFDAGRCGYGELAPPYDHFVVERDWTNGMPSHRGRWRLADFGDELVSENRAGRTLVIDDALGDERSGGAEDALQAAGGLRASIGVPLIKDGKWVAAFFVHDSRPRRWTKGDVELVEEIAERTWAAVERARAELALRESEERQAFQLQLSDALASLTDPVDIQAEATRRLAEKLALGWCYFNEFDERQTHAIVLRDFHRDGLPSMVGVHDLSGERSFLDLVLSGAVLDLPDLTSSELFSARAKAAYGAMGIRSALGVPLLRGAHLVAVLLAADSHVRTWTRQQAELLSGAAERTWAALQRARTEKALREKGERSATS
jgi:GAF domain-containing protein